MGTPFLFLLPSKQLQLLHLLKWLNLSPTPLLKPNLPQNRSLRHLHRRLIRRKKSTSTSVPKENWLSISTASVWASPTAPSAIEVQAPAPVLVDSALPDDDAPLPMVENVPSTHFSCSPDWGNILAEVTTVIQQVHGSPQSQGESIMGLPLDSGSTIAEPLLHRLWKMHHIDPQYHIEPFEFDLPSTPRPVLSPSL